MVFENARNAVSDNLFSPERLVPPATLCPSPPWIEPLPPHSIIKPDEYTEINQDAKGW